MVSSARRELETLANEIGFTLPTFHVSGVIIRERRPPLTCPNSASLSQPRIWLPAKVRPRSLDEEIGEDWTFMDSVEGPLGPEAMAAAEVAWNDN